MDFRKKDFESIRVTVIKVMVMMKKSFRFYLLYSHGIVLMTMFSLILTSVAFAQNVDLELYKEESDTAKKTMNNLFSGGKAEINFSDELKFKPGKNIDQDNYEAKAAYWTEGVWGITGNIQENDIGLFGIPEDSEFARIDVNRKFLQADDSGSFMAVGLGLQSLNIQDEIDSEGINLSVLGEYAFSNKLLLFGNGTLFQGFNQSIDNDVFGYQVEAGLNYEVGSQLSFSAGIKVSDLENENIFAQQRSFSSSFLIGTSLAF